MKITIIGVGNMGGAIAHGVAKGKVVGAANITVVDTNRQRLDELQAQYPAITIAENNSEAVKEADVVIIAVKPWLVEMVIEQVKHVLDYSKQQIISIAAGITTEQLGKWLEKPRTELPPCYYVIPNTAVSVGSGMTFIAERGATVEQKEEVQAIFAELGKVMIIEEQLMGACMALASCGIAFAMRYVRAATEGGVELGLYPDAAKDIVLQTIKGAVDLLLETGSNPETEIDKVTTPGGITIKGLNEMDHAGFSSSVIRGLKATVQK